MLGVVVSDFPDWTRRLIDAGIILAVTFVVNWIVRRVIGRIVRRIRGDAARPDTEERQRAATIAVVLRTAASALLWAIALMLALSRAGLDIAPLLAAAGIGGLAIGFGAQNLVRDVLAGLFVLIEDQYNVGDVVQVAGVGGRVEKVTLRTTTLRDMDGKVHIVPNGEIRVSTNLTKGYSRYVIDLPVGYEEDVDRVVNVVRKIVDDMRTEPDFAGLLLGPLEVPGVDDYGPGGVVVKMYVDTLPAQQWIVGRELRGRVKRAFDEEGISIPLPQQEMIVREGAFPDKEA